MLLIALKSAATTTTRDTITLVDSSGESRLGSTLHWPTARLLARMGLWLLLNQRQHGFGFRLGGCIDVNDVNLPRGVVVALFRADVPVDSTSVRERVDGEGLLLSTETLQLRDHSRLVGHAAKAVRVAHGIVHLEEHRASQVVLGQTPHNLVDAIHSTDIDASRKSSRRRGGRGRRH